MLTSKATSEGSHSHRRVRQAGKSLFRMYLDEIYHVKRYITLGNQLWEALSKGDIEQAVELYNTAIAGVPYDDFPDHNSSIARCSSCF